MLDMQKCKTDIITIKFIYSTFSNFVSIFQSDFIFFLIDINI